MLEGIEVLCHSSIRISKNKAIYIDPFKIDRDYNDADYIFITHEHYDHFYPEDIDKVKKKDTLIIMPESMRNKEISEIYDFNNIIFVEPNNNYSLSGLSFDTTYAYNINKEFHPKENNWVGYILHINKYSYYIAGDTDITEENLKVKCDVAFVPVGGTYTMTYKEAANFVNSIKPKVAIPTHYGEIVGDKDCGNRFISLLNKNIEGKILI